MKNPANFLRKCYLLLSAMVVFTTSNDLFAQTTWTGATSTAWNTAGNWSAGVPDAADDVTIPNVTNDPLISVAGAVAKSVTVQSGGLLTISAAGVLSINGSVGFGMLNQGTMQNSGIIHIGNVSAIGGNGIQNEAAFNNNSGGQINLDRIPGSFYSSSAVYNTYGTFTNAGTIRIGANAAGGWWGLQNFHGNSNNTATGIINISNTHIGIDLTYGGISNAGIINIGPAGSAGTDEGISCSYGTFNNATGGQININRVSTAIVNYGDNITNAGTFSIGAETAVSELFDMYQTADAPFSNNTGGNFKASGTLRAANFINAGGALSPGQPFGILTFNAAEDFTNNIMNIDVSGKTAAGVNYDRINVNGTATLGGTLALNINFPAAVNGDQVTILSATTVSGTFSSVTGLPANWYLNYTPVSVFLSYQPIPSNTWTGNVNTDWNNAGNWSAGVPLATDEVTIPDVTNNPEISTNTAVAKSVRIQTGGILTIAAAGMLTVNGGSIYGVWNKGSLINWGKLRIGNSSSVGAYGIFNENIIQNFLGCFLEIDRASTSGIALISGTMNNAGTVTIGSLVPMTNLMTGETGTFSHNGGTVKGTGNLSAANFVNNGGTVSPGYSPGIMTFNGAETFASGAVAIEVNGTGVAGTNYDQVVVTGAATLGGTLNVSINYAGALADQVPILSASSVSGTFSTVNGLPAGWNVVYYPTSVVLLNGLPASTWTGAVSTAWNTAGNWSAGVPNISTDVTIPDVINDPLISTAGISVKSVLVQSGGLLTVSAAGVLSINGSVGHAFRNQGTVQNSGIIHIGNISAVGGNGIQNEAAFNNNSGGQINLDRIPGSFYSSSAVYNTYGTFTNAGTIRVGANAAGGWWGLQNFHGNSNNTATGTINISNTHIGIDLTYGGISNAGIINIGPAGSAGTDEGISCSYGTFNNATGGQININRVSTAIVNYGDNITNSGTFSIGAETAVSELFDMYPSADAPFSNNTGGNFKASGTLRAANFTNAGGALSPGQPIGILTFNAAEDFTNNIMNIDVNGKTTAGVHYDRINVNGAATLGGTLALNINFPAAVNGDQIAILSAASVTGTFSAITGLTANWKVSYTLTSVVLTYDDRNYWTGAVSTAWNTAGNWSTGIIPTNAINVIIPNVVNDPVISVAGANARTVHVQPGASLTITNTGSLTTHAVATFNAVTTGFYNQGTVNNSGSLTVNKP